MIMEAGNELFMILPPKPELLISTVSRVMNKKGNVDPEMKRRIEEGTEKIRL